MKSLIILSIVLLSVFMLEAQSDPEWVWAHGGGGVNVDSGRGVSTDSNNNCYLTGWFNGTASFGTMNVTSINNSNDILVIKANSAGDLQWIVTAGGEYSDNAYAISTDAAGTSYITGEFYGTATFGSFSITSTEAAGAFVSALDTNGNWLWATSISGSGYGEERGYGIAANSLGGCYVTGYIKGNASFGTIILNTSSGDDAGAFVAKVNASGSWLWAHFAGGNNWLNQAQGYAIACNADHVFTTGYFTGAFDIGLGQLNSVGSADIFIACLNSAGESLWARSAGGNSMDTGLGIAADGNGNCYVTGYFESTAAFGTINLTSISGTETFVAKLNSTGAWQWVNRCGGFGNDRGNGIAADSAGNSYLSGYYNGASDFGSFNLTPVSNSTDIFAAKLDTSGNWQWAESAGGISEDYAMAVACDNNGNCYATGNYSNTVLFGDNEVTGNYLDIFIARHSSAGVGNDDQAEIQPQQLSVLHDAYPNPSLTGQNVILKTDIAKGETGILSLYNLCGQKIAQYEQRAGENQINFDSSDLTPGVYFYQLYAQTVSIVKKLVILK